MVFHNPEVFFLFIPLCGIGVYSYLYFKKKNTLQWSSISILVHLAQAPRVFFKWIPVFLYIVSFLLLITALARPQKINVVQRKSLDGIDIMIALDISLSMMAEDMNPGTRLDSAKNVIQKFTDGLSSDRVGLIVFSGESYTKVPLTLDYQLLKTESANIETSSEIEMGTAIGSAIVNAVARLRHSQSKSRIIILLTDGENNRGSISPETAVSIAQKWDIRVYSIGLGSQRRAKVPIKQKDALGRERTVYSVIDSKINTELLSKIAQDTNGKFYLAQNLTTLKKVFDDIGQLETSDVEVGQWTRKKENFQDFLNGAVVLYALALILSITVFGRIL